MQLSLDAAMERTFTVGVGLGGQIYSIDVESFGEMMPPQWRPEIDDSVPCVPPPSPCADGVAPCLVTEAPWVDEVFQVVVTRQGICGKEFAIHQAGTKIVMTTHDLEQARRMVDEILFLHRGRLLEHTPAEEFFREPRSVEARKFLQRELVS